jgi:hypothetical protein
MSGLFNHCDCSDHCRILGIIVLPRTTLLFETVTRQDWNRLFELFHGTRERSGPARNVYLRQECGGDHSLMAAVEQLLLEDEEAGSFLSRPLSGLGRALGPVIAEGQQFGRYTVISLLGRGGMGEVWRPPGLAWTNSRERPGLHRR